MDQFASSIAQAIGVLFSQSPSWTTAQKQAANAFILETVARPEAFHALLVVLGQPGQPVIVQFFAVNLLLDKVRKGWQQLSVQDQGDVVQQLVGLVSSSLQPHVSNTNNNNTNNINGNSNGVERPETQVFWDRAVVA
ncbi:hypothetical protein EON64_14095, partial [archaeon]